MAARRPRLPEIRALVTLKLNVGPSHLVGPRGANLLREVRSEGSITKAARASGMSYKSAWSYLAEMCRLVGRPLVRSVRGGAKGGGGSRLTDEGEELLRRYDRLRKRVELAVAKRR